jgi:anti-sigma regulatory factor (Ser/Thr protein kinase)
VAGTSAYGPCPPARPAELVLRLWPRSRSCGQARHAVRTFCYAHALAQLADDAELLTSELVTNAIEHTGSLFTLIAICNDGGLIVNVRDDGGGAASFAGPAAVDAESGRGLQLVESIAGRWGTARHGKGKSVWFRLP